MQLKAYWWTQGSLMTTINPCLLEWSIVPNLENRIGGPTSFLRRLRMGLEQQGIKVNLGSLGRDSDVLLVINATKNFVPLLSARGARIPIIQRLGGINWMHRTADTAWKTYLKACYSNLGMLLTAKWFANHIVYQSRFVEAWWQSHSRLRCTSSVIYNGVDLNHFSPYGESYSSDAEVVLISVEGHQKINSEPIALKLIDKLQGSGINAELLIIGKIDKNYSAIIGRRNYIKPIGYVPTEQVPFFLRGADIYVSTDVIAACPNSVIEAMACGVPVVGFTEGALPEIIRDGAGKLVPYNGDVWKLEPSQNISGLMTAVENILSKKAAYSSRAREIAYERFNLDTMIKSYIELAKNLL